MRDLRCNTCGRRVGFTSREQAVPVQCTDPTCPLGPARGANEERDSFIEYLAIVEDQSASTLAGKYGMTRQRVSKIMASR